MVILSKQPYLSNLHNGHTGIFTFWQLTRPKILVQLGTCLLLETKKKNLSVMRDIFRGLAFKWNWPPFSYFHSLNTQCVEMALEPLKHQWIKIHLCLDNFIHSVWRWQQMGPWAIYEGHQINKTRSRHNGHDCIYKQDLSSIGDIGEVYAQSPKYTKRHPSPYPSNSLLSLLLSGKRYRSI